MGPLTSVFRGRSNSSTPPRAVYHDLPSAYTNITGRPQARQDHWAPLSPGWAGDQPATVGNPKSTPISEKARTTSGDLTGSPLARRTRASRPAPVGTPEIPDSELGTRFPNVSPQESRVDARILWPERDDSSAAHRRSRSVGDFSNLGWYEAIYGSGRPLSPMQNRLPSTPQALEESPFSSPSRPLLANFNFPSNDGVNPFDEVVQARDSPRGILAHSTISDIINSYGNGVQPPENRTNLAYSLAHGTDNNPFHQQRQLSQTAWSPRPSNEGAGFAYQTRSMHGSILNVEDDLPDPVRDSSSSDPDYHSADHEGHDAVQEVIDQVFNPQAGHADRGTHATAYAALVRPNGQTMSRGLSRTELMRYEQLVQSHVRDPSNPNIFDAGSYTHEGRLSLEYQRPLAEDFDIDRPISLSSSSTSIGTWDRRQMEAQAQIQAPPVSRQGTPPLLFGNNAIGQTSQGPSASIPGSNDEGDWETVEGLSRQETRGLTNNPQGNNSSFADYSSSSTGMRQTGLPPGGQVLQHPPHPRYVQTWNMYRDRQTGETVILPDTGTPNQGANSPGHTLSSPGPRNSPSYQYHHPSPLSEGHTNPFTSSPVSGDQGSISQYSGENSASAGESDRSFLEMSPSANKPINQQGNSSGKDHSSAWISTEEGPQDIGINFGAHPESSAQASYMGFQGNVTGTPEGTGARELGSSIANASSPGVNFSSSPFALEVNCQQLQAPGSSRKINRTMSVDTCLSSLSTLSSNDSYRIHRQQAADRQIDSPVIDPEEHELTALPSFAHLPPDARFHRQQLIDNNLLPRDSPPFSVRRSLGLGYLKDSPSKIKKATAATGANIGRHFQQFVPNMPSLSHVRKRSPHRRDANDNHGTSDIEMQSGEPHRGRQHGSRRNRDTTKSKVSDSEGSDDSDVGLTSSTHHQPATDPSMSSAIEQVELEGVQVHPTHTGISYGQTNTARNMIPIGQIEPGVQTIFPHTYGNNTQYNLRRLLGPPSVEEMLGAVRDGRPTPRLGQVNRPIARAESPHLYRLPRPTPEALLHRHKELGRVFLAICSLFPPVCLFYAAGYFDQVMDMLTRGELTEMPAFEKKVAWAIGGVSFAVLTIAVPVLAFRFG